MLVRRPAPPGIRPFLENKRSIQVLLGAVGMEVTFAAEEPKGSDTQPSQTCSEGYTFSATALYRGVSLFLGSIN